MIFWSDIGDEELLASLSTSSARWLSLLLPIEKLLKSWKSLLGHLLYQYKFHSNHEGKKTLQWLFHGFGNWEARLSLAGVADVLGICMATKNALESVQGLDRMKIIADRMNAELSRYCEKNSILAAAMSGEAELPGQATHAEVVCEQYRREHEKSLPLGICSTTQYFDFLIFKPRARPAVTSSQHMLRFFLAELRHLQYKAAGQQYDDWVNIPPIRNRDEMKKIFRRVGDFAKACAEKVLSRFEYRGLWAHAAIFNLTYQFDQNSFQTSVFEIATSLNIEFEDVLPEMRRIFAQRDSLLNSHTFKSSQDLWCRVLKEVASEHMPHAKRLLSAFLLAPPQAAACERAFAQITQLRKAL